MPHLYFDYNAAVAERCDMAAFAETMRQAIPTVGPFPVAGVRVRGFQADVAAIADGGAHGYLHMQFRIGSGRDLETRRSAADALYAAAEAWLAPRIGALPFALSLEIFELPGDGTSLKRFNTIRDHLAEKG